MPARLDAPVLTVDVAFIRKVDTRNVENLFSMWTVFSRCAASLEEGRRLENLSWRLWNRETFCCDPVSEANATTPAISEGRYSITEVPSLSGSLDSLVDEEVLEFDSDNTSASTHAPLNIAAPQIKRADSIHSRSRGRERHITPDDLEKMVTTIKEKKDLEPFPECNHAYLAPLANKISEHEQAQLTTPEIKTSSAETTAPSSGASSKSAPATSSPASGISERSTTSIVRGFSPAHISSSYRSIPLLTAPSSTHTDLTHAPAAKGPQPKKNSMFALGGSSGEDSLSEQTNSMETGLLPVQQPKKKTAKFSFGGSSNEDESSLPQNIKSQTLSVNRPLSHSKKQTSFKEEVATRTIKEEPVYDDDVFETDEDEIDESAIEDDDDSSDWEDSVEESGNASIDERTFFQRVDSRPNLTSRRSLITTMLHQNDRANALLATAASRSTPALQRSRTSSPHGPSLAASPESEDNAPLMMKKGLKPIAEIPPSAAQPIVQSSAHATPYQLALSPRTTRRNMLASELTVSLRQHLLWERKQKSQTANAVLKRRHTSHDVANLRQYPEPVYMDKDDKDSPQSTWNEIYGQGLGEYHSRGW